jgi:hypothetical protein
VKVVSHNLPGIAQEKHKDASVRVDVSWNKIQTGHLPNENRRVAAVLSFRIAYDEILFTASTEIPRFLNMVLVSELCTSKLEDN